MDLEIYTLIQFAQENKTSGPFSHSKRFGCLDL